MTSVPNIFELKNGMSATNKSFLASCWRQFQTQFPTEQDCWEELLRRAREEGVIKCRYCGSEEVERKPGDRVSKCKKCKKITWLTAGTFFNRIRLARPWLAAIWLMEHGVSLSSSAFHKLVGIAYSSALNIFKKLTLVIQEHMGDQARVVPSSLFCVLVCKRSKETPARAHPIAEQEEIDKSVCDAGARSETTVSSDLTQTSSTRCVSAADDTWSAQAQADRPSRSGAEDEGRTDTAKLDGSEKEVYELLSADAVAFDILCSQTGMLVSDMLAALTMLELNGLAVSLGGNRYARLMGSHVQAIPQTVTYAQPGEDLPETARTIPAIIDFVRSNFQGISRKYLQNYIAAYWCHADRTRWPLGSLLQACLHFRCISDDEIRSYVSPRLVRICPDS